MELTRLAVHAAAFLLDVSLRSLVLFAATGLACLAMRRASAAARHVLWSAMLGSLLLLPMLCAWLPRWNAPVLPSALQPPLVTMPVGERTGNRNSHPAMPMPTWTDEYGASEARNTPPLTHDSNTDVATSGASAPRSAAGSRDTTSETPAPVAQPLPQARTARTAPPPRPTAAGWLCVAWLIGFLAVLSRTVLGLLGAVRLVRGSSPVTTGTLIEATEEARRRLDLRTPLSVREGGPAALVVPMTFGVLRPVVLLPAGARNWPAERLRVVMMHEAAHVRRLDWATAMLAQVALALYWFHPLVWVAVHRLRVESEQACDDLVLNSGMKAVEYADHLMDVVRGLVGRRVPPAVVTMAYSHEITARLRTILAEHRNRRTATERELALSVVVALSLVVPLAALRPVAASGDSPIHRASTKPEPPQASGRLQEDALRTEIIRTEKTLTRLSRGAKASQTPAVSRFNRRRQRLQDRYFACLDQIRSADIKASLHPDQRGHWSEVKAKATAQIEMGRVEYRRLKPMPSDAPQVERFDQYQRLLSSTQARLIQLQKQWIIQETRSVTSRPSEGTPGASPLSPRAPVSTTATVRVSPLLPNSMASASGDTEAALPTRIASALAGDAAWRRTLANGIQVKLFSVTSLNAQYQPGESWKPDGKPLGSGAAAPFNPAPPPHLSYQFLVVFPTEAMMHEAYLAYGRAGSLGCAEGEPGWRRQRWAVLNYAESESPPQPQQHVALQVSIATGPETTLVSGSPLTGAVRRLPTGEMVVMSKAILHSPGEAHENGRPVDTTEVDFAVPTQFVHDMSEYRFFIIGQDGKTLTFQHGGGGLATVSGTVAHLRYDFRSAEVPLARVKEFRLTFRKSETAIFQGFAVRPSRVAIAPVIPAPPTRAALSIQAVSWRMTKTTQFIGEWPRGFHNESVSQQAWIRRVPPAIGSSGNPPGWSYLRDARGSSARSPMGDSLTRRLLPPDERNEVAYLVDQDIKNFIGLGLGGDAPHPWQEHPTILNGRHTLLDVNHWSSKTFTIDVYRWLDPVTLRLIRRKNVMTIGRDGHPMSHSVTTWSDIRYNQPSPPGVFDWSWPRRAKLIGEDGKGVAPDLDSA